MFLCRLETAVRAASVDDHQRRDMQAQAFTASASSSAVEMPLYRSSRTSPRVALATMPQHAPGRCQSASLRSSRQRQGQRQGQLQDLREPSRC